MTRVNSHYLDLLSHSVEVNERSGGERNVGVEEETRGSSIDGSEDGAVQSESEGELVSVLGVRFPGLRFLVIVFALSLLVLVLVALGDPGQTNVVIGLTLAPTRGIA